MTGRPERLGRISGCRTDTNDPWHLVHRKLFAQLALAANEAHGALLDIGCGNKPYRTLFGEHITSYTGCDVVQSSNECVDVLCPATAIPLPDATFQTVLCTQVIEHVADHAAVLKEAYRLLSPNGILILSAPMYWPLHEEPHDYFRFTEYGLAHLLEAIGFADLRITVNGGKWAVLGQVLIHTLMGSRLQRGIVIRLINRIFRVLDDAFPDRTNTLNYVAIATKPG